jgi:hypothetical protein
MPKSMRVFEIPNSHGMMLACDQMSEEDHNDNWTALNSNVSVRGTAVLFRVDGPVDKADLRNGWQLMFRVALVPIERPAPQPARERRVRRK